MYYIIFIIISLLVAKRYLKEYKTPMNRVIIFLSIWLVLGFILRLFFNDERKRQYTDVEMAQVWIQDHPDLKPKMKIQDDGSVIIKIKGRKLFYLKDGVLSSRH
jgi:hypothetical protein